MSKTLFIILISLFVFSSCKPDLKEGKENSMKEKISQRVIDFLGENIIDIIKNPDSVESYRVKLTKSKRGKTLGGYPIVAKGPKLSDELIKRLQDILLDEGTYLFDVVKKCLFLPEFAIQFIRREENVILLICYSCEELTFVYNDKELLEDFDPATPRMRSITDELFK